MDWRAVQKVKCIIHVLLAADLKHDDRELSLSDCHVAPENIPLPEGETNGLTLVFPDAISGPKTCDLSSVQDFPCIASFTEQYAEMVGVEECGECAALPSHPMPKSLGETQVYHDGFLYQTLQGGSLDGTDTFNSDEQSFTAMPAGFEVAPDTLEIAKEVVAPHHWDVWRLCTMTKCWAGKAYTGHSTPPGSEKDDAKMWETDGLGSYRIITTNPWYRLLIRKPFEDPRTHAYFEGYVYRTLYGAPLDDQGVAHWQWPNMAEEEEYKTMPEGYAVAPDSEVIAETVIGAYEWNQWRVCTETKCWAGNNYDHPGVLKDDKVMWEADGDKYRIKPEEENWYRLLIRKPVPAPLTSLAWNMARDNTVDQLEECRIAAAKFGMHFQDFYWTTNPKLFGCYSYTVGHCAGQQSQVWFGGKPGGLSSDEISSVEYAYPDRPGVVAIDHAASGRIRVSEKAGNPNLDHCPSQ